MKISTSKKNVKVADKQGRDVIIDGNPIYIDLSTGNIMKFTKLANELGDEPDALFELSKAVFEKESFELVEQLELQDFITVMDIVVDIIENYQIKTEQRFERA